MTSGFTVSRGIKMRSRGASGFGIILTILILLVVGYSAYKIAEVHFTHASLGGKVEAVAKLGITMTDEDIVKRLMADAQELQVQLNPDSIFVDRDIPDSIRIYVAYSDSSDIFGIYTYSRHLVIDKVEPIKVRY
jgi:hypothetical protein